MLNTNAATAEKNYTVRMSSSVDGEAIEETNTHTRSEIIDRAAEALAKEAGIDLATFAELKEAVVRGDDGDTIHYVDKSGKTIEFTDEMKFNTALTVLNSHGQFFEATPLN